MLFGHFERGLNKMLNKKGQNSTIAVTIAIVLGIALIVFLIWGFSTNWNMFKSTSSAYGSSTVDIVKDACRSQCDNGFDTEFCIVEKDVVLADGTSDKLTCPALGVTCDNAAVTSC